LRNLGSGTEKSPRERAEQAPLTQLEQEQRCRREWEAMSPEEQMLVEEAEHEMAEAAR
jgi:hypothetical protein